MKLLPVLVSNNSSLAVLPGYYWL